MSPHYLLNQTVDVQLFIGNLTIRAVVQATRTTHDKITGKDHTDVLITPVAGSGQAWINEYDGAGNARVTLARKGELYDTDPGLTVSVPSKMVAREVYGDKRLVMITHGTFRGLIGHIHAETVDAVTIRQGPPEMWEGR